MSTDASSVVYHETSLVFRCDRSAEDEPADREIVENREPVNTERRAMSTAILVLGMGFIIFILDACRLSGYCFGLAMLSTSYHHTGY